MNVIIGAGISGLTIGYLLHKKDEDYIIFERDEPGGWCRTYGINKFRFDAGGHFFHSMDESVEALIGDIGVNMNRVERRAYVYWNKGLINYPIQSNIARLNFNERLFASFSYIFRSRKTPENLKEFFITKTGRFLYDRFLYGYNKKMWGKNPEELPPYFLGRYFPETRLFTARKQTGYNPVFFYPPYGIGEVIKGFLKKRLRIKKGKLEEVGDGRVKIDGKWIRYRNLFLTIPLPEIIKITPFLKEFGEYTFDYVGMKILLLGVKGKLINNAHWIYFAQKNLPFTRVGSFTNISKEISPNGYSSIWIEVPVRNKIPEDRSIIDAIKSTGLLDGKVLFTKSIYFPYAYPIRDDVTDTVVKEIEGILERRGIHLSGRFARWEYNTMSDSIKRGMELV
ncbi:NAD(P)-binding protein [candidate division WOR-3 bacterium]|nr:NAD(P)-binding protein [candidate division WOR-3 bacterium]